MKPRHSYTVPTGEITREPYASRTHCAHGHKWTPATERWRYRNRPDRGAPTLERDCRVCRRESEARRRRKNRLSLVGKS